MRQQTECPQGKIIIAIDGHSSSGKSTMAKRLAKEIGYRYIDSGAMYRAVTLYAMKRGFIKGSGEVDSEALVRSLPGIHIDFQPGSVGQRTLLNGQDVEDEIRGLAVSEHVSPVAAIPEVRSALTAMQKGFGRGKGIVMDGRDIGTTVFPEAEMKVFVTASPEERARRRTAELEAKGEQTDYAVVLENIKERDHLDETRAESPLRKAADAFFMDNSAMSPEEQDSCLLDLFHNTLDRVCSKN